MDFDHELVQREPFMDVGDVHEELHKAKARISLLEEVLYHIQRCASLHRAQKMALDARTLGKDRVDPGSDDA